MRNTLLEVPHLKTNQNPIKNYGNPIKNHRSVIKNRVMRNIQYTCTPTLLAGRRATSPTTSPRSPSSAPRPGATAPTKPSFPPSPDKSDQAPRAGGPTARRQTIAIPDEWAPTTPGGGCGPSSRKHGARICSSRSRARHNRDREAAGSSGRAPGHNSCT